MNDVTLSGDLHTVDEDVLTIIESSTETGLRLNTDKCEIISEDFTEMDTLATFRDFTRVNKQDMTILGAPVLKGKAQDKAIQDKIEDLTRAVEHLAHIQAHDTLVILKNSLAIPKLLYLLRTSECAGNPLLRRFDDAVPTGLINILNLDLNDDQCLQASLPVGDGGLGIRSDEILAPSAFLSSAASTFLLQQFILPGSTWMLGDPSVESTESLWTHLANSAKPAQHTEHIQKAWDGPVAAHHRNLILSRVPSDVDKARLLAGASPHSGDWLQAPPITAVELKLSDEVSWQQWPGDWVATLVNHTRAHVESQWTLLGCMDYPVVEALPDNNVTII